MIVYLDTSALVPLLVPEPGTAVCRRLWDDAGSVVSTRLLYAEGAAAIAQARRQGRLTTDAYRRAQRRLEWYWSDTEVIEVDQGLVNRAAILAEHLGLRGYDSVHCAAAELLEDPELVAASGDQRLLTAWNAVGVATFDPTAP